MHEVLFLCTGNSARSIIAEVLLNELHGREFHGSSAGSQPAGAVNPGAIKVLAAHGHATADLRSKSWEEFGGTAAPRIDTVITVCDNAAAEVCPAWPGAPETVHWGLADPASVTDDAERAAAFEATYRELRERIAAFAAGHADA